MSQTVVVIDYGSGNLHSAMKSLERAARDVGCESTIVLSATPHDVSRADRIVLPGVGAFADCYAGLSQVDGLLEALEDTVHRRGRPFLGICVGMQLMATRGLEFGETPGFGWIAGDVVGLSPNDPGLKIPHMGWNCLMPLRAHALLDGIALGPDGLHAYFVHSFQFLPTDRAHVIAETDYGGSVTAMVAKDNLAGTQFHPEKSQHLGLALLANFLSWLP